MKIKYQNEMIRKQVKENATFFEFIVVSVITSIVMIAASFIMTYVQNQKQPHIPFEELAESKSAYTSIYYGYVIGEPEKLAEGYYGVSLDDYHFILKVSDSYVKNKIIRDIEENGNSKIHGTMVLLNRKEYQNTCQNIAEYYHQNHNPIYATDYGYRYLEVLDGSLLSETTTAHPVGLIFGITGLLLEAMMIHWGGTLNMLKHLRPACGSRRYTVAEIDEQANMPDAVWFPGLGICLAPKIMIGIKKGVTAVEYSDISRIKVTSGMHLKRTSKYGNNGEGTYRTYDTYQIVVKTKRGKRLVFSDYQYGSGTNYDTIFKTCRERNPDVVIKEAKSN